MVQKMKNFTIVLARHSKSLPILGSSLDFERGLKDKGIEQAHHVGKSLKNIVNTIETGYVLITKLPSPIPIKP